MDNGSGGESAGVVAVKPSSNVVASPGLGLGSGFGSGPGYAGMLSSQTLSTLVYLIVFLVFLANIVNDIYLPSLPRLASELSCSDEQVVLTMTSFCIGVVLAEVFFGYLINRWGKRCSLLGSAAIFLVGIVWAIKCASIEALIAARLVQGIGVSGLNVSSIAVAKDNYARRDRLKFISYITMTGALAPLLGPVIGGYIDTYLNWRFNFELLAVLTAAALIVLLPKTANLDAHSLVAKRDLGGSFFPLSEMYSLLTSRHTIYLFLGLFVLVFCLVSYLVYSPFLYIDELGVSSKDYGLMQLPVFTVYIIGLFLNERIAARVSAKAITNTTITSLGFAVTILLWEASVGRPSYGITCLAVSIFAAIYGFYMPLVVSRINQISQASSGVTSTSVHLSMSLGSLAGAMVYVLKWDKHLIFIAIFLFSAGLISLVFKKENDLLVFDQ